MAYNATTQIFSYMDEVSKELVASNVATIIAAVTPLVALGLTIVLMVEGAFKLYGGDGEPLTDMLKKFAFWASFSAYRRRAVGIRPNSQMWR